MSSDQIFVLMPSCGVSPAPHGGGEVFERRLLEHLPRHGVVPVIGLPTSRALPEVPDGWDVSSLSPGRGLRWYLAPTAFLPFAMRRLRTGQIDLLRAHAMRFVAPSLLLARALLRSPVPVVGHHHHRDPGFVGKLDVCLCRRVDHVVVDTRTIQRDLIAAGVSPARISVISPGASVVAPIGDHRGGWTVSPGARLMFVGRLIERKRPELAVRCLIQALRAGYDAELAVVGSGPLESEVRRLAQREGAEARLKMLGALGEQEKVGWIRTADLTVMPSTLEGFGLVAAESMLLGTPVVAGPAESLLEVAELGGGAVWVGDSDPSAFVTAALEALRPSHLRVLASEAATARDAFSWDTCAAETASLYRTLVRPAGARARALA